jgi:hypothetical protein
MAFSRQLGCRALFVLLLATAAGAAEAQSVFRCEHDAECGSQYNEAKEQAAHGLLEPALRTLQWLLDTYQDPRLLYSIARLFHRMNRFTEEARAYQRFLDAGAEKNPDILTKVRQQLAEAQMAAARAEKEAATAAPPPQQPPPPAVSKATTVPPADETTTPPHRPLYKRGWFWGVVGTLAATGIAVGVAVHVAAITPPGGTRDLQWSPTGP